MILFWIVAVLGRYALPSAVNFDGVRHFLELFPALAWLGGLGAHCLLRPLVRDGSRRALRAAALALLLVPGASAVLHSHPFQLAYCNVLVGGLDGALQRGMPQAGDYWGASYRLGLEWLNENAEPNAMLAVPVIEHAVRLVAPQRLRPDIALLPIMPPYSVGIPPISLAEARERSRSRPLYVMFVPRGDWMNSLMAECLQRLQPVETWSLDGRPSC